MKLLRRLFPLALAIAWFLVPAAEASAESCIYDGGNLGSWHEPLNWDCGHVPGASDSAAVPQFTDVSVAADASADAVHLGGPASSLTFSNGANLAAGSLYVGSSTLQGNGSITVSGAFHKGGIPGADTMFILDSVDVFLNGDSLFDEGVISVCQSGAPPTDPTLHINADLTIAAGSNPTPFNCSSSGARIRVGPTGHLIKATAEQTTSDTAIDNDGKITAQAGTLLLKGGTANSLGAVSDGGYLADAGAVLEFQGGSPPVIGAGGRLGGAGTVHVNTLDMDMAAGSILDPAVVQISGSIRLRGTAPVTLPDLELTGGTIDSDRPVAVDDMDVTAGALQRDFTLTVQPGGSFTKTGAGTLFIRNNGSFGSADLVLDADASLEGGQICVSRTGTDLDVPGLYINQDFTIGSGAPASAFQCGPQFDTLIHLNGPDGHLSKVGSGTTNFNDLDLDGGTLSVGNGQTFVFPNTYAQSGGVTEVASGGTLQASPAMTGGVLRGGGQVSGNLTNASGTVSPGTSPGTLSVTGSYAQGAGGVLGIDVDATGQGTGHDHLAVGGAVSLDGTVAVVKGAGFDPTVSDTFQFLSSASRTGSFDALVGSRLASGKGYVLDYPGASAFGSRLTVTATPGTVAGPTLTDTDPDSFADDNSPELKGTAAAGSTVALYPTPDCSGPAAAVGSAAAFASPGLTAQVADDTTTTFRATASLGTDTSPCSSSIEYIEDSGPADVIVDASTTQGFLDSILRLRGSLIMDQVDTRPTLIVPNLTQLGEDLAVTGNDAVETINLADLATVSGDLDVAGNSAAGNLELGSLGTVAGNLEITDNPAAGNLDLGSLGTVGGNLEITDNASTTVSVSSLDEVSGNLILESTGSGNLDLATAAVGGDAAIDAAGHSVVTGSMPSGSLELTNSHPVATMTAEIPAGALAAAVPFTVTHIDPAALPPAGGNGPDGQPTTIDPVAAWQFDFTVPTLNQDATLTFEIQVDGLDPATRADFLAALDSGVATLATRGDAPGGTYRAFSLCAGGAAPSADGCVAVTRLDANGQPTGGTPAVVRFAGVIGHFSTWAVAIAEPTAGGPSNEFSLGKLKLNKRKGTASLALEVPGPGTVALSGKDLKSQRKTAGGAGTVKLTIKPKGNAKSKLRKAGKTTLKAVVTYTPSGGDARTKTKKVKLKRSD